MKINKIKTNLKIYNIYEVVYTNPISGCSTIFYMLSSVCFATFLSNVSFVSSLLIPKKRFKFFCDVYSFKVY